MTKYTGEAFIELRFPERLKLILSEKKITHQELANVLGVQRQTVGLYVNGQIRPDIGALAVMAKYLNVTTDWLLGLTDDRKIVPIATDDLMLSETCVNKIKSYHGWEHPSGRRVFSALEMLIEHEDFDELVDALSNAISNCSEALEAHRYGETEYEGEQYAQTAAATLEGTRWTVITSAKYAEYLVYNVQQVFHRIINDLTNVQDVHDIMEY